MATLFPQHTTLCILAALASLAPLPARAADPSPANALTPPVPPAGEPIKRPKLPAAWSISFKYNGTATAAETDARPVSINVTVIGEESVQTVAFPSRGAELWKIKGQSFLSAPGSSDITIHGITADNSTANSTAFTDDQNPKTVFSGPASVPPETDDWASLREFDWVKSDLFKGKIAIAGQPLLIFAEIPPEPVFIGKGKPPAPQKWPAGPLGGLPLQPGIRVVAVDEATRLPKYLQLGDEIRQYTFSVPTQAKLEIPAKVRQLIDAVTPAAKPGRAVNLAP